jgi:hypothetical protein
MTDARLWHPWLRINRVLRVMLHTRWSAEAWSMVRSSSRRRSRCGARSRVPADEGHGVLRAELSKSKEPRDLPLTSAIKQILERRWQARLVSGKEGPRVCDLLLHRDGQPVRDFRAA